MTNTSLALPEFTFFPSDCLFLCKPKGWVKQAKHVPLRKKIPNIARSTVGMAEAGGRGDYAPHILAE